MAEGRQAPPPEPVVLPDVATQPHPQAESSESEPAEPTTQGGDAASR
jgi:hypothetical protein